jgi:hypothetical protein
VTFAHGLDRTWLRFALAAAVAALAWQLHVEIGLAAVRKAETATTITVMTSQGPTKRHPHAPPGDVGDTFDSSLTLFNVGPQFGKPVKAKVGSMRFTYTLTKVCRGFSSSCKATADFATSTELPGGTIAAGGKGISIAGRTISIPVTGGSGRFAHASGTLTMGPSSTKRNVYKLTLS